MIGLTTQRWLRNGEVEHEQTAPFDLTTVQILESGELKIAGQVFTCQFEFDPALEVPAAPSHPDEHPALIGVVRIPFAEVDDKMLEEIGSVVAEKINRTAEDLLKAIVDRGTSA